MVGLTIETLTALTASKAYCQPTVLVLETPGGQAVPLRYAVQKTTCSGPLHRTAQQNPGAGEGPAPRTVRLGRRLRGDPTPRTRSRSLEDGTVHESDFGETNLLFTRRRHLEFRLSCA